MNKITITSAPALVHEALYNGLKKQETTSEEIKTLKICLECVYQNDRITIQDTAILSHHGVPIYTALSDIMGVSREKVLDCIKEKTIPLETFHKALVSLVEEGGLFYDKDFRY